MSFKNILDYIRRENSSLSRYKLFRKVVIRALEQKAIDQNRPTNFDPNFNKAFLIDLPNGLDDFSKPVVVDIRLFDEDNVPDHYPRLLIKKLDESKLDWTDHSLLAIVGNKLSKAKRHSFEKNLSDSYPNLLFKIWDIQNIESLFSKYAEYLYDLIPELTEKAVQNVVSKSLENDNWSVERSKHIDKLRLAYSSDNLVLFLGAGVSASAKLPSWDLLLSQLLISLIERNLPEELKATSEQKKAIASSLKKANGASPILEARFIRSGLGNDFEKTVSDILYSTGTNESELISAITELCTPPRGYLGTKAIINYNFDDLIEDSLSRRKLQYRSIFRETDLPSKKELGIYHVHGFLPRNKNEYDGISDSLLVFSEENYHLIMQEPYHWSNLVQLNFLKDSTCLLIGLSGTDPNLRRLLEIAKRKTNRSNHYILLKRQETSVFEENLRPSNPEDSKLIKSIHKVHHNLNEHSLEELGLNIIWFESYDEIPQLISQINN